MTRGEENGNLRLMKSKTALMKNCYLNKEIQLFNQLPNHIELIDNNIKLYVTINMFWLMSHYYGDHCLNCEVLK